MGEVVIVCGGRNYRDKASLYEFMDSLDPISTVVTGAARGADSMADEWAQDRLLSRVIVPANWDGEGRGAGFSRNERMIRLIQPIHRVVAFPGGNGTQHMIRTARDRNVPVTIFNPEMWGMLS